MISIERQLRNNFLLLESRQHHISFKYKTDVIRHFYLVDGSYIRNNGHTDFIGGGNAYAYPWMPKDEVWLEDVFTKKELAFFVMHEIFESCLMKFKKFTYDDAHDAANHYESLIRKTPKKFEEVIKKYVKDEYNKSDEPEELSSAIIELWNELPK